MKIEDLSAYFHREGFLFMGLALVVTLGLAFVGGPLFCLAVILTAWCFYFFRDPPRVTPLRDGLIVSPADGKVVGVQEVEPDGDLGLDNARRIRISIFLNIFNVHVNRIPADGTVKSCRYRKGTFVNASLDKASTDNERMAVVMELSGAHPFAGKTLGVVQIAGLIARRIVCTAHEGESFRAGQRYGIIRFGSRTDIYLPAGVQPLVAPGQTMVGGETVLADCLSSEPARAGKQRE